MPPGLTFPLPVPARRGGAISLDFMELPRSRSGRDFLQVQIDLLTGRVLLVPTVKTCTSEMAAANFVGSVFRDVGLPDCIVSDRDTRFVAEFGLRFTIAWGLVSSLAPHITTRLPPRTSVSMGLLATLCGPLSATGKIIGTSSFRSSSLHSTVPLRCSVVVTLLFSWIEVVTLAGRWHRP